MLDIAFNATGTKLASASADSTAKIYSVSEATCLLTLKGIFFLIQAMIRIFQK